MNERQKDKAMDEIYAVALATLTNLGRHPNDDKAEALLNAISEYLGDVD